ncbi:hypothetical protein FB45DRAFT_1005218 [Roridomyces roridus]|uniref:Uncharacterized protein n=1 Tax=Roridomyces roridus TaxID=1738132 RepID=A0AAD7FL28_9AGAR|nr:hypothetical protein FB45DRAFT_1005218 [Roridomyces roridus]
MPLTLGLGTVRTVYGTGANYGSTMAVAWQSPGTAGGSANSVTPEGSHRRLGIAATDTVWTRLPSFAIQATLGVASLHVIPLSESSGFSAHGLSRMWTRQVPPFIPRSGA